MKRKRGRPTTRVEAIVTRNNFRRRFLKAYVELRDKGGWRAVGKRFGVTKGMAYRIAVEGYEPHTPRIRANLGLPVFGQALVCPTCGKIHVTKYCTRGRKSAKPRRDWKGLSLMLFQLLIAPKAKTKKK